MNFFPSSLMCLGLAHGLHAQQIYDFENAAQLSDWTGFTSGTMTIVSGAGVGGSDGIIMGSDDIHGNNSFCSGGTHPALVAGDSISLGFDAIGLPNPPATGRGYGYKLIFANSALNEIYGFIIGLETASSVNQWQVASVDGSFSNLTLAAVTPQFDPLSWNNLEVELSYDGTNFTPTLKWNDLTGPSSYTGSSFASATLGDAGIHAFVGTTTPPDAGDIVFDNITISAPCNVPEPSSTFMLISSMVVLARRKR